MKSSVLDAITMFLAELIGMTLVMFFGCMGCITFGQPANLLQSVLNFSFIIMSNIQIFGYISGAYLNPSVTVAALIYKRLTVPLAVLYMTAQLIGSFIGVGLLKLATPSHFLDSNLNENITEATFCMTIPHSDLSYGQSLMIEFIATAVLVLANLAVWDHRNEKYQDSVPLRFGFVVFVLSLSAGPLTGCSMNPARSFGPAFWAGNFNKQWIYWVAPLSSAVISTYTFRTIFWTPKEVKYISCEAIGLEENNVNHTQSRCTAIVEK